MKLEWPPLPPHTSTLSISKKISSKPHLTHHCGVNKNVMSPLHKFYFNVVHKIILPCKKYLYDDKNLDLNLVEILGSEVPIDLPFLIVKHMHMVLHQDDNGHALPYGFWMTPIFVSFDVPVQVWFAQTIKDVVGKVNYMALPVSLRNPDNTFPRLKNKLADKEDQLLAMENAHWLEKATSEAHIVELQN